LDEIRPLAIMQGSTHEIPPTRERHTGMSSLDYVRCHECQVLNEAEALFCSRCGASLDGRVYGDVRIGRRRVTGAGVAMGLALFLILLTTVFVLGVIVYRVMQPSEQVDPLAGVPGTTATTGTTVPARSTGTTNGAPTTVAAMLIRPRAASASSVLKATASNNYRATNLLDGDLTTAWNEGADGSGIGEWVRFEFLGPVLLSRIEIANGYQKDDDRFDGNIRIRSLEVEYSSGIVQLVDLLDTKEMQTVMPTHKAVEWVKLTIVSVYPGYEWEDAALSEVRMYGLSAQE